jgi:hypothetical protein
MHGIDTKSEFPAVHLPNLDVKTAKRLDEMIGRLKAQRIWNAVIRLFVNGGHVDAKMEASKVIRLNED